MVDQPDLLIADEVADSAGPRGDILAGAVMLVISAVGWWMVLTNAELVGTDYAPDPGPGMLPQIALGLLALLASVLVGRAVITLRRTGDPGGAGPHPVKRLGVPALMVATLLVYTLVFPIVGFIWTTLGFAVLWSVLLGIIEFRPAGAGAAVALYIGEGALITLLVWLAFAKLIGIPLP